MSHVIAALSTANQVSAIGILRLSGEGCAQIAGKICSLSCGQPLADAPDRKLMLGFLHDSQGRVIDQVMAVYCRAPHSYTGEDTVELHCHGSPAVLAAGLEALYQAGAAPAERGEFTKRAFLNGHMDLTQAEAVIDLIDADSTDAAANAAGQVGGSLRRKLTPVYDSLVDLCSHFHAVLDYPDEDIPDFGLGNYVSVLHTDEQILFALLQSYRQGRILRQGLSTVIVGKPNAGKSSLLNALAGFDRVIVTDIPGTTRDTIEQAVLLGGTRLRLVDTAGIRETADPIEAIGVSRSRKALQDAELALFICDGSVPLDSDDQQIIDACMDVPNVIALINKTDLGSVVLPDDLPFAHTIPVSIRTGEGLSQLSSLIQSQFSGNVPCDGSLLTNARQCDAIRRAHEAMLRALEGLSLNQTPDAVLLDIEEAMGAMGEVTGATVREDITSRIFQRFCVGK